MASSNVTRRSLGLIGTLGGFLSEAAAAFLEKKPEKILPSYLVPLVVALVAAVLITANVLGILKRDNAIRCNQLLDKLEYRICTANPLAKTKTSTACPPLPMTTAPRLHPLSSLPPLQILNIVSETEARNPQPQSTKSFLSPMPVENSKRPFYLDPRQRSLAPAGKRLIAQGNGHPTQTC